MDWQDVDAVARNDQGDYVALVNGSWMPAQAGAKNDAGKYMAILRQPAMAPTNGLAETAASISDAAPQDEAQSAPQRPAGAGVMWDTLTPEQQQAELDGTRKPGPPLALRSPPELGTPQNPGSATPEYRQMWSGSSLPQEAGMVASQFARAPGDQFARTGAQIHELLGKITSNDAMTQQAESDLAKQEKSDYQHALEVPTNPTGAWALQQGKNLLGIAPALAAGAVMPEAPALVMLAGTFGVQNAAELSHEAFQRGADPMRALGAAAAGGVVGAATAAVPMAKFVRDMGGAEPIGRFLAGYLGRDVPAMAVQYVANEAINAAVANPDATWADFASRLPDMVADATKAAAFQTVAMTAAHAGLQAAGGHQAAGVTETPTDTRVVDPILAKDGIQPLVVPKAVEQPAGPVVPERVPNTAADADLMARVPQEPGEPQPNPPSAQSEQAAPKAAGPGVAPGGEAAGPETGVSMQDTDISQAKLRARAAELREDAANLESDGDHENALAARRLASDLETHALMLGQSKIYGKPEEPIQEPAQSTGREQPANQNALADKLDAEAAKRDRSADSTATLQEAASRLREQQQEQPAPYGRVGLNEAGLPKADDVRSVLEAYDQKNGTSLSKVVKVVQSISDLPPELRPHVASGYIDTGTEGLAHNVRGYLIADNIDPVIASGGRVLLTRDQHGILTAAENAIVVAAHEAAHVGEVPERTGGLDGMTRALNAADTNDKISQLADILRLRQSLPSRARALREALAKIAGAKALGERGWGELASRYGVEFKVPDQFEATSKLQRWTAAVKEFLGNLGATKLSDSDVLHIITRHERNADLMAGERADAQRSGRDVPQSRRELPTPDEHIEVGAPHALDELLDAEQEEERNAPTEVRTPDLAKQIGKDFRKSRINDHLEDSDIEDIGRAWMSIGKNDDLFTYPKPDPSARKLDAIAGQMSGGKVEVHREGKSPISDAVFKPFDDEGEAVLNHAGVNSNTTKATYRLEMSLTPDEAKVLGREKFPKVNAYVYTNGDHAALSIPSFRQGTTQGNLIYQIVGTWAHRNGIKFMGDPQGLSNRALVRRAENLMVNAIRTGSTSHLMPHLFQEQAGLKWRKGNDAYNVGLTGVWLRDILRHYDPEHFAGKVAPLLRDDGSQAIAADGGRLSQVRGATEVGADAASPVVAAARRAVRGGERTDSRMAITTALEAEARRGAFGANGGDLSAGDAKQLLSNRLVGGVPERPVLYSRRSEGEGSEGVRPELVKPARMIFEVAPDPNNRELSDHWNKLDDHDRYSISRQVAAEIMPRVLKAAGARGQVQDQIGSYQNDTNPSFAVEVDDPSKVMTVAHLGGYALSQESTIAVSQRPFEGGEPVQSVTVNLPRDVSIGYVRQIYDTLREIKVGDEQPIAGQTTVNGEMAILNYSKVPTEELAKLVDEKLGGQYDVHTDQLYAAFPTKEDYDYAGDSSQGSAPTDASVRDAARDLRAAASDSLSKQLGRAGGYELREAGEPAATDVTGHAVPDRAQGDAGAQGGEREAARGAGSEQPAGADVLGSRRDDDSVHHAVSLEPDLYGDRPVPKFKKLSEVGEYLDNRAAAALGGRDLTKDTPENRTAVADTIHQEVSRALAGDNHAAEWYRDTLEKAMGHAAEVYPEIGDDLRHEFAFKTALAITSNGQTIPENVRMAFESYEHYRRTGELGTGFEGGGERGATMRTQIGYFNSLVREYGEDALREKLLTKMPVREIEKEFGRKLPELKDQSVYAGSVFGPKIGGGFLPNLMGRYDTIAIDRWLMRTWGRLTGGLQGQGKTGLRDSPSSGGQRAYIRGAMEEALDSLHADHPGLTHAGLQATLWYPEKQLYEKFGVTDARAAPTDYAKEIRSYVEDHFPDREPVGGSEPGGGRVPASDTRAPEDIDVPFSRREEDRTGPAEPTRGSGRDSDPGWVGGTRQEDASVVDGIHYGKNSVPALSGSFFGQGIRGAEAERLRNANDPRLRRRVYFYRQVNPTDLPRPESGLGAHVYSQRLGNMYDSREDPRNLSERVRSIRDPGERANAYESAVLNEGFDGYHSNGVAVVLNHDVPVRKLGMSYELKGKASATDSERNPIATPFERPHEGDGRGEAEAAEDRPAQSRTEDGGFDIPPETFLNRAARKTQDAFNRSRIIEHAIDEQGGHVDESNDVYAAQALSNGRKQYAAEELKHKWLGPLVRKLSGAGISPDELALYAYAKHAPERNAYIDTINPGMKGQGSGMSNADAAKILSQFKAAGKEPALEDAHQDLMGLTAATRRVLLDEGLITPEQHDAMENQYENYVPLRGFERADDVGQTIRKGQRGINVRGDETTRALGRRSRAANIIENAVLDYERAINRSEDNNVGKTLLKLVLDNPDKDLWEANAVRSARSVNPMTGLVEMRNTLDRGDNTIGVKLGGKEVYVKLHDDAMYRGLANKGGEEMAPFMRSGPMKVVSSFGHLVRNTATHWNPMFALRHPVRAAQRANATLLGDLGAEGTAKFNTYIPAALAAAVKVERGQTLDRSNPAERAMADYRVAGGLTGSGYLRSLEDVQDELHRELSRAGASVQPKGGAVGAAASKLVRVPGVSHAWRITSLAARGIESAVKVGENGIRSAAFRAAKEMGKSDKEAALISRNVITDFARKGEWGPLLNGLYLFYNAAIQEGQGIARIIKNPKVMAMMGGYAGLTAMLAVNNSTVGGTNEDGFSRWDKEVPEYEKAMNTIIMLPPKADADGKLRANYIKIPAAYGMNVFGRIGYAIGDAWRHSQDQGQGQSAGRAALNVLQAFRGAFDPVMHDMDMSQGTSALQSVLPTAARLPYQLATETGWTGAPSAPAADSNRPVPSSQRFFQSQLGTLPQGIAESLNRLSGGDRYRSGLIDVTPGSVKTIMDTLGGQTGKLMNDAYVWASYLNDPKGELQPTPSNNPLKDWHGQSDARTTDFAFNEAVQSVEKDYKQSLEAMKHGEDVSAPDSLMQMGGMMDEVTRALGTLNHDRASVLASDASEDEKASQLREIAAQQEELRTTFLGAYHDVFGTER